MKAYNIIIKSFAVVVSLLIAITMFVPLYQYTQVIYSGQTLTKIYSTYLFDIFSTTSVSFSSSSLGSIGFSPIALLICGCLIISPIGFISNNKVCQIISIASGIIVLALAVRIVEYTDSLKNSMTESTTNLKSVGSVFMLICGILNVAISVIKFIEILFGEKILAAIENSKSSNSVEKLLEENKNLLSLGYITEEEFLKRKSEILEASKKW